MPGKPAARVGDQTAHGGVITGPGAPTVLIGKMPASVMGDMHVCPLLNPGTPPPPHVGNVVMATCASVLICKKPAARMGDTVICQGPPDSIVGGCPTVLIGDGGGGGGGGGGGAKAASEVKSMAKEVEESHYLDAKFVDKGGKPITGVEYTVKSPEGEEAKGPLTGQIKKKGLKEGDYDITLKAITKAEWSKKEAKVGDKVKMTAETAGIESGAKATLEIFIRDANFADHLLNAVESEVSGDKIEAEWELQIDDDLLKDQKDKDGKGYSSPLFYFKVTADGVNSRSGLLKYKDYIEMELKDEEGNAIGGAGYKLYLPDGSVREGKLDSNGYAKEENIPPGQVKTEYDPRQSGS
jgi:uncharacterized Zn-binding protein involved in type VI secretion